VGSALHTWKSFRPLAPATCLSSSCGTGVGWRSGVAFLPFFYMKVACCGFFSTAVVVGTYSGNLLLLGRLLSPHCENALTFYIAPLFRWDAGGFRPCSAPAAVLPA